MHVTEARALNLILAIEWFNTRYMYCYIYMISLHLLWFDISVDVFRDTVRTDDADVA